ncbi:undecaprenyldiphospho-muramoylpentapeptide beta-N-acetylglucosaminyltransferase [Gordonibacter sp. Marseille-P4307]|uniref:undecaprenyldiphospho-muramoylpentapeptide beta-N-acetylglucosaminyltransferase n=1 Tax=Gordonibacter sp. Marseille-P4307 TaxID=2161815 RepID=UPI000F540F5B|nr:undecaprenyldiphospho-muramoylpentapeptide beta-N-acetylglucosaminyltransferase [Gordonibacter sp. Marseille-P4307]
MRIVLSGGGTAGHINPALALAEALKERGHEVFFAGTPRGIEARLAVEAGLAYEAFEASGFDRAHPVSLPKGMSRIARSTRRAVTWFDRIEPDAVAVFGGYVCIPVGRAALKGHVPLIVHEQNSVMGLANRYLGKRADAVCLTYGQAAAGLNGRGRVVVTGNPVRASVLSATREEGRALLGIPTDAFVLLVTGGSLGARHVNGAVAALKDRLLSNPSLHVVHVTGPKELASVQKRLALTPEQVQRWHLFGYQSEMGKCMAAADAIVSRAGATSLAEIAARAIPAVLVPFPHATADHQTMNARSYVEAGCALLIADDEVDGPKFESAVCRLVEDGSMRASMTAAARNLNAADAASLLADEVERAVESRS